MPASPASPIARRSDMPHLAPPAVGRAPSLSHILPFALVGDHVMLQATVGSTPAWLLLDTGSALSSLDEAWARSLPVRRLEGVVQVTGLSAVQVSTAVAPTIRVGAVEHANPTVILLPLEPVARAKGHPVHGVLGFDFLSRFVVEIDYARRELRLHDPGTFEYRGSGTVVPVRLDYGVPVAELALTAPGRGPVAARLVLDIGSSTLALHLSPALVEANPQGLAGLSGPQAPLGTGIGVLAMGTLTRLEALRIGSLTFPRPTAAIAHERRGVFGIFDGAVGVPVLGQTTLIVDYARERVILESSAGAPEPPAYDASGLHLTSGPEPDAPLIVTYVVAASPASDAGVRAGDEISAVDGRAVGAAALDGLRRRLREDGREVRLVVRRDGHARELQLVLRALL